jgi:Kdo2-lipid IVA lauroyltransferase/acyltransferase
MAKPRNDLIDRLTYLALRTLSCAMQCCPIEWILAGARLVGETYYLLVRKHRERAMENLRPAFPELDERELRRIARESMRHLAYLGVEVLFTPRLVRLENWNKLADLHDFSATLKLLLDRHRGVILLTGHYGNWEVLGYMLATLGFSTSSVARPLDNPYINDWLLGVRERKGQRILSKFGALEEVPEVLQQAGAVGFIADQNAGKKGMFVDFFNRKASTYKSIGLLAMRYNVPVVIGYARRREGKFHFDVGTQDIIHPADWENEADPLRYVTQRYTKAIESIVRAAPEQYLWVHRRWKTRPKDELAAAVSLAGSSAIG